MTDWFGLVWREVEERHAFLGALRQRVVGGRGREGQEMCQHHVRTGEPKRGGGGGRRQVPLGLAVQHTLLYLYRYIVYIQLVT